MTTAFAEHDAFFDDDLNASTAAADAEADAFFSDGHVPDAPADSLLQRLREFAVKHAKSLADMREAISPTVSEAWDEQNNAIAINCAPYDQIPIAAMTQTDNAQFTKVTTVISVAVSEAHTLRDIAESRFYGPIHMHGHKFTENFVIDKDEKPAAASTTTPAVPSPDGVPAAPGGPAAPAAPVMNGTNSTDAVKYSPQTPEQQFGDLLPILQDLNNFLTRLFALARNLLTQLGCLYHERQKLYLSTFKMVRLDSAFEALGILARICLTIDALVTENEEIQTQWQHYKRMIKFVRADPAKYGVELVKLRLFESLLLTLDKNVLNGGIYETLVTQEYGLPGGTNNRALIEANKVLFEQFQTHLKFHYLRLSSSITADLIEITPRIEVVELFGLYGLFRRLFAATTKPDKKLFNELWSLQKKVPLFILFGDRVFLIPEFMGKYCPIDAKSVAAPIGKAIHSVRVDLLTAHDETFDRRTEEFYMQMCVWMVRMESALKVTKGHPVHTILTTRAKLLLNGLLLANQIRNHVTVNIFMHMRLKVAFRAKNIRSIAICAEMLRSIHSTYLRRQGMISEHMSLMIGQVTYTLKHILGAYRKKLEKQKKIDDAKLDQLAALILAHQLLEQPPTQERQIVLNICIAVGLGQAMHKDEQNKEIRYQLWRLQLLSSWQRRIDQLCNCSFLYFFISLVKVFFEDIYKNPDQINRLQYIFSAYRDASVLFSGCTYKQRSLLRKEYMNEILFHLNVCIITPICREIETDLRLHIHSVVLQQASLRAQQQSRDLTRFIDCKPIAFFTLMIDIKQRVTHYLDSTFYNLNTVALHDWRVYAEMRNLANLKYGLVMTEVHLPGTAHYSEALDVLEIMRNIHIFVAKYNYNMNIQMFIQRAFDQKHLNTINIYHISDSLRTHGTGVMNTTVNFTYQFLVRKFKVFSEFLFDDHIKSRLIKQAKFYRENREKLRAQFPYEKADQFMKDIRKLGVSEDGNTFLDQFRRQITEIGNALGYVRMVRSGGLHHCSQSIKFVPDLQNIPKFKDGCVAESLSAETIEAAQVLDNVLADLYKNFTEGTEYYQLLVKIFTPVLKTEQQKHLQNFYVIIPALTLNFIEKIIAMKEKLSKQGGKFETAFSDDGFALGLAYILKVLDLDTAFNSLHWFDSVNTYINNKRAELTALVAKVKSKKNEEEIAQLSVQVKRLLIIQNEFELLHYAFAGARVFFQEYVSGPATGVDGNVKEQPAPEAMAGTAPPSGAVAPAADIPTAPPVSADIPMAPPM